MPITHNFKEGWRRCSICGLLTYGWFDPKSKTTETGTAIVDCEKHEKVKAKKGTKNNNMLFR